jgi:hypothetical protein
MASTYIATSPFAGGYGSKAYAPSIVSSSSQRSHGNSTTSRSTSRSSAYSSKASSSKGPGSFSDLPDPNFFNRRKVEKQQQGLYPTGSAGTGGMRRSSDRDTYPQQMPMPAVYGRDEEDDDYCSVLPEDSISCVSERTSRSYRYERPHRPMPSSYSGRSSGSSGSYRRNTVIVKPKDGDLYPVKHTEEFLAQTKHDSSIRPYYQGANDFHDNYIMDVVFPSGGSMSVVSRRSRDS